MTDYVLGVLIASGSIALVGVVLFGRDVIRWARRKGNRNVQH